MKHSEAMMWAESLVEQFKPVCERIEIKGSLCRMKPDVKDIDLLVIPDLSPLPRPRLEFGKPVPVVYKTALDKMLAELREHDSIIFQKAGDRSKKFLVKGAGISVEIYLVLPPATWGVRSVIRTGPAEFSHWIVTRRKSGGALPDGFRIQDGAVWEGAAETKFLDDQTCLGFDSELDFMNWLGLGWIEPKDRVARWK